MTAKNTGVLIAILALIIVPFILISDIFTFFQTILNKYPVLGAVLYSIILAIAVVFPFFNFYLFVLAGGIWHPLVATLLGIIGWGLGSAIVFYIVRILKISMLHKFNLEKKFKIIENSIKGADSFWNIVILRMFIPVDVLSYALAILTSVPFKRYIIATFIGITPFAILFSYTGGALVNRSYLIFLSLFGVIIALFIVGYRIVKNRNSRI